MKVIRKLKWMIMVVIEEDLVFELELMKMVNGLMKIVMVIGIFMVNEGMMMVIK